ncbi:hypothetical protein LCGC14_0944450 [marine sediment metagenome]|uniref:Uncharacterized protein n=1 Tax=marine sediment metagenome TaxID=412755 RepID=A0A0F9NNT0_9ZZZZ
MSDDNTRVGHWEADGGDVNIPLGFVPDYVKIIELNAGSTIFYHWFERMEDDEATGSQEGVSDTGGTKALLADDAGIKAFSTGSQSPVSGTGAGQLSEWAASTSYTAKTSTARGSFVRGTVGALNNTGQVVDREAIFEAVIGGTSGSSEPTWPSAVGDQVLDSTPVWELVVDIPVQRTGYQGFVVADNIQTNGREYYYLALKAHDSIDHGDVDGWPSGTDPDWS